MHHTYHPLISHSLMVFPKPDFWTSKSLHCRNSRSVEGSQWDLVNNTVIDVMRTVVVDKIGFKKYYKRVLHQRLLRYVRTV